MAFISSLYKHHSLPFSHFLIFSSKVIAAKETGSQAPVKRIENCSFLYARHVNMYFVALTRSNVNPALVFEYLFQKIRILKAYLGEDFDENSMRNNMTLIYELMDETMDFGYPQNCAVDVLRLYINLGNIRPQDEPDSQLTSQITGAIDWRREGIRHRKNEVYIDVLESVNLSMSSTGTILTNEVTGQVQMNTKLSKIKKSFGRVKYEPENHAIVWRVKRFPGKSVCLLGAEVDLMPTVRNKTWNRPPINAEFQVPMFTGSGVHVRFLRVFDKSGYQTSRWVRYITKAGGYQIRI